MARIPLLAYPAAFAGALVAGRVISGGSSGPASDATTAADTTTPATANDGWTGFDNSGSQFGSDGSSGGVLPAPITTPTTPPPPTGSTVTDINGAAPDRIGVRPSGATGWVVVSGSTPFYTKKTDGTYARNYTSVTFSAWVATPFSARGTWGTNWVARILSGSHAGQLVGTGTGSVSYTRG